MYVPCKGCKERCMACHSTCDKYKAFAKERQEARQRRALELAAEDMDIQNMKKVAKARRLKNQKVWWS